MSQTTHQLQLIYDKLLAHFGPQHWWPGDTPFEICVGAILTQNTAWTNVEKAITRLKNAGLLEFEKLHAAPANQIAELIRPAGYYNIKTKRLKSFLNTIAQEHGSFEALFELPTNKLREFILSISGIGPETADSMVLYAFHRPVFVVDAYTNRLLTRHRLIDEDADYFRIQEFFTDHFEENEALFNEYHALIVMTGKTFCRKTNPKCEGCPLGKLSALSFQPDHS